jgi:carboxyl-terminal processing protease
MQRFILSIAISLACGLAQAKAAAPVKQAELHPQPEQAQAATWVSRFLSRFHYRATPLDDKMSAEIFKRYLDALDGGKWFFTAADIASFKRFETTLDDAIVDQDLEPAFAIFKLYQQRVTERTAYVRGLLKVEPDFTVDESFAFERKDVPWAVDAKSLDDLWRKRMENDALRLKLAGKDWAFISTTLDKRYKDFLTSIGDINSEDVAQTFLNSYTLAIDPHSNYFGPRASENFNMNMRLSLEGIGALLQRDGDYAVIRELVPGGPAEKGGKLLVGDRVISVTQGDNGVRTDVIGWRIDDVVDQIRGKKGTTVKLEVLSQTSGEGGKSHFVSIVRDQVKLDEQAAKKRTIEVGEVGSKHKIGVIDLPTFYADFAARSAGDPNYRSTTRDVKRLITELKAEKVEGIVIDLRNNGGGALDEATELAGLFIDQGPVVQVKNSQGSVELGEDPNPGVFYSGPLMVMVNRGSASASEIFAGAIQDYGRGLILGETTFGKGTVQNLIDLDRYANLGPNKMGELKMTMAQFFRVTGNSTQNKGVVPDIAFPTTVNGDDFGESNFDNALPYSTIAPAKFLRVSDLSKTIAPLDAKHKTRMAVDREFQFITEDLAEYQKNRDQKEISLNLAKRKSERDVQEKKIAMRAAEREKMGKENAVADAKKELDDGLDANERALTDAAKDKKKDLPPDPYLLEAARVMADFAVMKAPLVRVAQRTEKK